MLAAFLMHPPDIAYLTNIYFESGAIRLVPELQRQLNIGRPLVVTDEGIIRSGLLDQLIVSNFSVFHQVETNPTESSIMLGLEQFRAEECDGLIAFGGGSPIDVAKGIALMVHHALPLEQYSVQNGGIAKITSNLPPVIAIPTTAGTGSEVGRAALLTLATGNKVGFLSPHLLPKAAVCDPLLTVTMPSILTAATGMDAISHCIETFCSHRWNPVAEAIALDGLARGISHIEIACNEPENRQARSEMMLCALEGGLTFQKGLGAVHSLSHALGSLTEKRLHHGTLNAIFLPHVLRFNQGFCRDKLERIAHLLGPPRSNDLPEFIEALTRRVGLPSNLGSLGVKKQDLEPLVSKALNDHCTATNPRPLDEPSVRALYLEAL